MDYSYFNSAPHPYPYFSLAESPAATQHMDVDGFAHVTPQHQPQPQPQPQHRSQFNSPFAVFQDSFHYDQSQFLQHAAPPSQLPSRAPSRPLTNQPSISPGISMYENVPMSATESVAPEENLPHHSSSEERDNMTPQQSKRKAQNRAAQRAFRERKEQHLKMLESKISTHQKQLMSLDSENEKLRKELARIATENEILRATASGQLGVGEEEDSFGPLGYTASEYTTNKEVAAKRAQMLGTIHTIVIDDHSGELLLNSSKAWDYIQAHESFRDGLVDVGDVVDRLKKMARCDGQGPVFRESDILKAISESAVAGGRDELL